MNIPIRALLLGEHISTAPEAFKSAGLSVDCHALKRTAQFHQALTEASWDVIIADEPFCGMTAPEISAIRNRLSPATPLIFIVDDRVAVSGAVLSSGEDFLTRRDLGRLPAAVQRAISDAVIRRKHWEADGKCREQTRLNQVILDAFPHPIMLIKPRTFEIAAANKAASGLQSGGQCYRLWDNQEEPCSWCLAKQLWDTGEAQTCEVEFRGRWWEAHWIPVDKDHYMHYVYDITERKKNELKVRHLNAMLALSRDINEIIVTENDEGTLLKAVCRRIGADSGNLAAWIGMSADTESTVPVAWSDKSLDFKRCIGGRQCAKRQPGDHQCVFGFFQASVSLPLSVENRDVGVLNICARTPDALQGTDLRLMEELACDLSLGIEKIRKRNELRQQKEYAETLADNLPIGLALNTISDGRTVFANRMFEEIYGWPAAEITDVEAFFNKVYPDPEYRRELKSRVLADITSGDPARMRWDDLKITTQGGDTRYISAVNIPLFEQNLMISTVQDITARKKAEKETELRAHVLDTVSDSVFLSESSGKILYLNQKAFETRGYRREELMGANIKELRPPDAAADWDERRSQVVERGEATYESTHRRRDGSVFPVEVHARSLEYDGRMLVLSVVRDITQRKQAEIERQRLSDKAEMSSRLAAVGEMAAGIAHEINNPLTGVIGYAELLMGEKYLPETVRESISVINYGSQRVKDIVSRMLTFARQTKPLKSAIDINELIDTTIELRAYVLRTANIEVVRQYDPGLPWVVADPGQLQQVILNLIVNAEYSMKRAHDRGTLTVKTEQLGDNVRISVADDGLGIAPEVQAKLFQPFFTTKETGEGTGLGLSLSFGIIKEHGGSIQVESEPGRGAAFIIELPLHPVAEAPPVDTPKIEATCHLPEHAAILIVDDEPYVRSLVKAIFKGDAYTVDECDGPEAALEKLEKRHYDLLLLDIRMPGMSGMELFERISGRWPELGRRVIFITGDTSDLVTTDYLTTRDICFITKPFTRKTLESMAEKVLSRCRLPAEVTISG